MAPDTDRDIELGVVGSPHGLKGEITLHCYNAASDLPRVGMTIRLALPDGNVRKVKVRAMRGAGKGLLVTLAGVTDRNGAEDLKGARVIVRREDLPDLDEGEFYYDDMPGLPVRLPDGTEVGRVTGAFRGATDVLELDIGGREVLLPVVEGFVVSVGRDGVVVEPSALEEPL